MPFLPDGTVRRTDGQAGLIRAAVMSLAEKAKQPRKGKGAAAGADESGKLPYRVEIWTEGEFERVLALAAQATLARAIYAAAISEHPDRLIVLTRGAKILARSAD